MSKESLQKLVQDMVAQASALKNKYTTEISAPINYACIFSRSDAEYRELTEVVQTMGKVVKVTNSGSLYHIENVETVAGTLRILKIRIPDVTRPERGDADFTVSNYAIFKNEYLQKSGFKLILRPDVEMIELMEPNSAVRAYFSHPPIDRELLG